MAAKKSYNRYFIIFQEEDKGFGIAMDKQPTGYTKIETKNGRCKITVYVQNLVKEKGPYICCLIDATKNPGLMAKLGEIKIDESGRGETWWEYKEDDIVDTGMPVDRFNVAAVLADATELKSPLTGYAGKDKVSWRDKIQFASKEIDKTETDAYRSDKEKVVIENEEPVNPMSEEAKKFDEYENKIKAEAEKLNNPNEKTENKEENKTEPVKAENKTEEKQEAEKPVQPANKGENKTEPVKAENKTEVKPEAEKPVQSANKEENKTEPVKTENKIEVKPVADNKTEKADKDEEKDEIKVVVDKDDMLSKDSPKKTKNSDLFHKILKGCEEVLHLTDELRGCRWWRIRYDDDIMLNDNELYPYYCVINHLKMTYPYINYVQYFKKRGYYYFGIKYDDKGEVKYLMYGVEGHDTPMHQPYKGTTGFSKWVSLRNVDSGMWIMYYNPYNGYVLIPKSSKER